VNRVALIERGEGKSFRLQKLLVDIDVQSFREVLIENEAKNVIAELVRIHPSSQLIGDVPKLLLELFLLFFRHWSASGFSFCD